MASKITVEFDDKLLRTNIRNIDKEMDRQVAAITDRTAAYATGYLKTHAPWTDRTGAARAGLLAVANQLGPGAHEILMSYSVYYGVYLELCNSGKYAIINPSMRIIGRKWMSDLNHILDKIGR